MPIYTRFGDKGRTVIFGGNVVLKSEDRVEAYGSIDELSSFMGLLICENIIKRDKIFLKRVQERLYDIMSFLAGKEDIASVDAKAVEEIEKYIDDLSKKIDSTTKFVLPRGSKVSCVSHIVRAVCRRAERRLVFYLIKNEAVFKKNRFILQYINRLSDALFIIARYYNRKEEKCVCQKK